MKVWTLITRETLRLLQEGIPYYGDKKICPVVDFPYTPGGYSLLVNKMMQTIGFPPDPSAAPIWGYYLYGGENNIPENLDLTISLKRPPFALHWKFRNENCF